MTRSRDAAQSPQTSTLAPPSGMRDLLPVEARARAELRRRVAEVFALYGYEPVVTPIFELSDVIERGLDSMDRRELLRFVEPETGEVALLRPDITPQIARIVATSLASLPGPHRLSYEGTVIRRRRGRARKQRQIFQVGGECIGLHGPQADVEAIEIAVRAALRAGLPRVHVELAHVGIAHRALGAVPEAARDAVSTALASKDVHRLRGELAGARVAAKDVKRIVALANLDGGTDVVARARNILGAEARSDLDAIAAVIDGLGRLGLPIDLGVDLGELRGRAYYTGVSFTLLADGPGEPIGGGGRYDGLMGRFGVDAPATGFGLDLENLEWALRTVGESLAVQAPVRVLVSGPRADAGARAVREAGVAAVASGADADGALAYARSWGYDCAVEASPRAFRAIRLADGASRSFGRLDTPGIAALIQWVEAGRAQPGRT